MEEYFQPFEGCAWERRGQSFCSTLIRPQEDFWTLWRENKEDMKGAGIRVYKQGTLYSAEAVVKSDVYDQISAEWGLVDDSFIEDQELECPISKYDVDFDILYPIQQEAVAWLCECLAKYRCALNGSGTGVGKTFMSLAAGPAIGIYNMLAITPLAVAAQWQKSAFRFHLERDFKWINYDKIRRGNTRYGTYTEKNGVKGFVFNEDLLDPKKTILLFDEIQCCKGDGTLNCKVIEAAARQGYYRIGNSATPIVDVTDARALTAFLGLRRGAWSTWLREFTGTDDAKKQKNPKFVKKLSALIYEKWDRGYRIARKKLPKNYFPDETKEVKFVSMQDCDALRKTYARHAQMMQALKDSKRLHKNSDDLEAMEDSHKHDGITKDAWEDQIAWLEDAREAAYAAEQPIVVMLRTMQLVEMHKVSVFVDLAKTFADEGNSVPIFMNYRWPLLHVAAQLKTKCIIMGGIHPSARQENLAAFQNNLEPYIVLNLASGGTGIDLHNEKMDGRTPRDRVSLISAGFSALQIVQAFGRTVRANCADGARVMQHVVFIEGVDTEEKIGSAISRKLECIDTFNQNDLNVALDFN